MVLIIVKDYCGPLISTNQERGYLVLQSLVNNEFIKILINIYSWSIYVPVLASKLCVCARAHERGGQREGINYIYDIEDAHSQIITEGKKKNCDQENSCSKHKYELANNDMETIG